MSFRQISTIVLAIGLWNAHVTNVVCVQAVAQEVAGKELPTLPGVVYAGATLIDAATGERHDAVLAVDPSSGKWKEFIAGGRAPSLSPDGRSITFNTYTIQQMRPVCEVRISDFARPSESRLVQRFSFRPIWSTDGHFLIGSLADESKSSQSAPTFHTLRFPVAGGPGREWTAPGTDQLLDMSRDGKSLIVRSFRNGSSELFVKSVDGSNVRRVAEYGIHGSFGPDGRRIAYLDQRGRKSPRGIHIVDTTGGNDRLLYSEANKRPNTSRWSPDGKWVVVVVLDKNAFQPATPGSKHATLSIVEVDGPRRKVLNLKDPARPTTVVELIDFVDWH